MPNGASIWTHSTTLAKPIEMFTKGVELRAQLRQIEMENQARTFNQTMEAIKQNDRRKEAEVDANQRQQQIDQQIRESENRMTLARENLDLRRRAMEMRASGGTSSAPTPVDSAGEPAPSVTVPDAAATPLPGDPSPANFMAAAPAGDSISPLDMSGDGQGGMPMQAIPSVDSVLEQNPTTTVPADASAIGGTIFNPVRKGNTEYAVINGVQSSRTISKTGSQSKWTALPGVKLAGAPDEEDPTAGIFVNADGIPVKKVGGAEMPVETVTQRTSAGSVTMRQPKKVDASKIKLNDDGTGTFTDDSGQSIPVRAKGVTLSNGKYNVSYEVPDGRTIQASLDDKMKEAFGVFDKWGLTPKTADISEKGGVHLHGSMPSEEKPKPETLGALTDKWTPNAKDWRNTLLDAIREPSADAKSMVIFGKKIDEVAPAERAKVTEKQWSDAYYAVRERATNTLADRVSKLEGVPVDRVRKMILGALPEERNVDPKNDELLPPIDAILLPRPAGQTPQASSSTAANEPPTTAPQKSKAKAFLDRITGKK